MNQQQFESQNRDIIRRMADIYEHSITTHIEYTVFTNELVIDLVLIDGSLIDWGYIHEPPSLDSRNIRMTGKIIEAQQKLYLCMQAFTQTIFEMTIPLVQKESTTPIAWIVGDSLRAAR